MGSLETTALFSLALYLLLEHQHCMESENFKTCKKENLAWAFVLYTAILCIYCLKGLWKEKEKEIKPATVTDDSSSTQVPNSGVQFAVAHDFPCICLGPTADKMPDKSTYPTQHYHTMDCLSDRVLLSSANGSHQRNIRTDHGGDTDSSFPVSKAG